MTIECRYCNGTGKDFWEGPGKSLVVPCEVCDGRGYFCDPPFKDMEITNVLSNSEVAELATYWCSTQRRETLGGFIRRVAQLAANKSKGV